MFWVMTQGGIITTYLNKEIYIMQKSLIVITAVLSLILSIHILPANDLSQFYCSPFTPASQGIALLTNAGAYADVWFVDGGGNLSLANSTVYLRSDNWSKAILNVIPAHEYIGYQGFYYIPFSEGDSGVRTRNLLANPIFYPDAGGVPTHDKFIVMEEDPANDQLLGTGHLDILASKIAFSETKLYFAIRNNATTFPVSSGMNFYSYMCVIVDPAADPDSNSTVFAMMYTVTVSGVISPGLYKITGTGLSDQTLIGEIETTIDSANSTLVMSCNLSDLLADPDFSSWFNTEYPVLSVQALTTRISLTSGVQNSDSTPGGRVILLPKHLNWQDAQPPVLTDPQFAYENGNLSLNLTYQDADSNFPSYMTWSVDGSPETMMIPTLTTGFDVPVLFTGEPITCPQNWQQATITYTVGNQVLTRIFSNPVANDDPLVPAPDFSIYPNPAGDILSYRLAGVRANDELRLYNLRGQLIQRFVPESAEGKLDLRGYKPGLYLLNYEGQTKRILKL